MNEMNYELCISISVPLEFSHFPSHFEYKLFQLWQNAPKSHPSGANILVNYYKENSTASQMNNGTKSKPVARLDQTSRKMAKK